MSNGHFRIDLSLPLGDALRQSALCELDQALAELGRDAHQVRKRCKRLRALLRLVQPALPGVYAGANQALRNAARAVAGTRRLEALRELCQWLAGEFPDQDWAPLQRGLPAHAAGDDPQVARSELMQVRELAAAWTPHTFTTAVVADRMVSGYRRGRHGARAAARGADAAALHEWRKQVKYHRHQCELMAPLWPALAKRPQRLRELGDVLGRHQDLHDLKRILPGAAAAQDVDRLAQKRWLRRIEGVQAQLATDACKRGGALFADSPRRWWQAVTAGRA